MYDAPTRRRVLPTSDTTSVNLIDIVDDNVDADFLELLKEYDTDDEKDDREKVFDKTRTRPLITQGSLYLFILIVVASFIYFVNFYNMKQLERLKEEYGMEEKKVVPEIWWRKALIYHIVVRSFKDSDGDGTGDLNGIRESIQHIDYIGATAVMLSAFYPSPGVHHGKDVTDFKAVDKKCGNMEDFTKLKDELHEMGVKIMIEVTPNHSSKRHPWFIQSRRGGVDNKFKDYYVWEDGTVFKNGTQIPPNNWLSRYGGSAWTWDEVRGQFYYHHFHHSMPDLNHRDPNVRQELFDIFQFWLEKGIDGILIDGAHVMFENVDVDDDEDFSETPGAEPGEYNFIDHIHTEDHHDIHEYLSTWKDHVDQYALKANKKIGLFVDVVDDSIQDVMKYYQTGADVPVCHSLIKLAEDCDARCLHDLVDNWITQVPDEKDPIWMLSSPFYQRMRRAGDMKYQPLMNMLILLLPGAAITYYGEEIAMPGPSGTKRRSQPGRLPYNMDWPITPMQWTDGHEAGFSDGTPYVNVHSSYKQINVQKQKVITELPSYSPTPLQQYQKLSRIRQQDSFLHGKLQFSVITENVFSFMRFAKNSAPYLVTMNFGEVAETNDLSLSTGVQYGKVVVHVTGVPDLSGHIVDGGKVNVEKLTLNPGEGVVLLLLMDIEPIL